MIWKRVLVFLTVPIMVLLIAGSLFWLHIDQKTASGLVFDIPSGDNLSSIVERLEREDSMPIDSSVFKVLALVTRDEGPILAGQYQLTAEMNVFDLLALFRSGKVIQHKLTFPEGWTLNDWLVVMSEAPYLNAVAPTLTREELAQLLGIEGDPEGWFFPDTYYYIKGDSDLEILQLAHSRMEQMLDEAWQTRGDIAHLASKEEALVLASIIEKETGYEPDRLKIASVFHNRLLQKMKLQSDPTVIYGLGDTFDGDLTRAHLRSDTPYNSYTRRGLPPGPICSPGKASIEAAVTGSSHGYLYFVAKGDGMSYFSMTLDEHNQAVNRYQKSRRSTP